MTNFRINKLLLTLIICNNLINKKVWRIFSWSRKSIKASREKSEAASELCFDLLQLQYHFFLSHISWIVWSCGARSIKIIHLKNLSITVSFQTNQDLDNQYDPHTSWRTSQKNPCISSRSTFSQLSMRPVDSESWFLERDIAVGFLKCTFLVLLCYIREKANLSPPWCWAAVQPIKPSSAVIK